MATVYEDRRRALNSQQFSTLNIRIHTRLNFITIQVAREAINVQSKHSRVLNEDRARVFCYGPAKLILVEHVVHLPEMSLKSSGLGCVRGQLRVLVHGLKRELVKDETDLIAVIFFQSLQLRVERAARRTLIIAVLVQSDFGVRAATRVRIIRRELNGRRRRWRVCCLRHLGRRSLWS